MPWRRRPNAARAIAPRRHAATPFIGADDLTAARTVVGTLAAMQPALPAASTTAPRSASWNMTATRKRPRSALASYVARDDNAWDWVDLARLTARNAEEQGNSEAGIRSQMAINGYLRATEDGIAAQALLAGAGRRPA